MMWEDEGNLMMLFYKWFSHLSANDLMTDTWKIRTTNWASEYIKLHSFQFNDTMTHDTMILCVEYM